MGKKNRRIKNKAFNRFEKGGHHQYVDEFPPPKIGKSVHAGMIKCKLVHGMGYSVIVPDFLFLVGQETRWFQPLFFTACFLNKFTEHVECHFSVDISHGHRLVIDFSSKDYIRHYDDGSELFNCKIRGPENLKDYCTGILGSGDTIRIPLFHHTSDENYRAIIESKYLRSSPWNFQGSNNKVLENVNYTYFTCLDSIKAPEDLSQIAMATSGKIPLIRDNGSPQNPNDVVIIDVYRESTTNRTHPIKILLDVAILAPSHLIKHYPIANQVYYQIMNPFIYRVGLRPGEILPFAKGVAKPSGKSLKRFEYVVIGDGRERDGLVAPFDEENTKNILKTQKTNVKTNMLKFWFEEGNQDLFTGKNVELQTFQPI